MNIEANYQWIPFPRQVVYAVGEWDIAQARVLVLPGDAPAGVRRVAGLFCDEFHHATLRELPLAVAAAPEECAFRLERSLETEGAEAYRCRVNAQGAQAWAASDSGLFYAIQSWRQMLRSAGCDWRHVEIDDAPEMANRGFCHDVTRGKVPTLATLKTLADRLAFYKINQLQLYIEHTFAWRSHREAWGAADPLTAADILELDAYCRERYITLVPALSTFGHLYTLLRSPRLAHLNEFESVDFSAPFSFSDRMGHYTLDCLNPESLVLLGELLDELLPLFTGKLINICCDETFDLGRGRNRREAERVGRGALYTGFLKKIVELVHHRGFRAMFWGDVLEEHPEFFKELPPDVIALEWDYSPEAARNNTAKFTLLPVDFYVCPGVSGWNQFLNIAAQARKNIIRYAEKGGRYGAAGLLNTDWGDHGHVNLLGCSFHGIALGAAAAWNWAAAADAEKFDRAFDRLELHRKDGAFSRVWEEVSSALQMAWWHVQMLFDPGWNGGDVVHNIEVLEADRERLLENEARMAAADRRMRSLLFDADLADPLFASELLLGLQGMMLMNRVVLYLKFAVGDGRLLSDDLRVYEREFCQAWHERNRPSEYFRVRAKFIEIWEWIDRTNFARTETRAARRGAHSDFAQGQ